MGSEWFWRVLESVVRLTDASNDERNEEPGTQLHHLDNVEGCEQAEDDDEDDSGCERGDVTVRDPSIGVVQCWMSDWSGDHDDRVCKMVVLLDDWLYVVRTEKRDRTVKYDSRRENRYGECLCLKRVMDTEKEKSMKVRRHPVLYTAFVYCGCRQQLFLISQQETKKLLDSQSHLDRSEHCLAKRRWCATAPVTTNIAGRLGHAAGSKRTQLEGFYKR